MSGDALTGSASGRNFLLVCMGPVIIFLIIVAVAPLTLAIVDSFRELSMIQLSKRGAFIGLDCLTSSTVGAVSNRVGYRVTLIF